MTTLCLHRSKSSTPVSNVIQDNGKTSAHRPVVTNAPLANTRTRPSTIMSSCRQRASSASLKMACTNPRPARHTVKPVALGVTATYKSAQRGLCKQRARTVEHRQENTKMKLVNSHARHAPRVAFEMQEPRRAHQRCGHVQCVLVVAIRSKARRQRAITAQQGAINRR